MRDGGLMKRPRVDSIGMFDLDAESIAARAKATTPPSHIPKMGESVLRGTLGFMLVSAIGFAPWAIFERWFRSMRESQLYIACTAAFILASGPFLHRLIIGPGSLSRFYKVFTLAFLAYAGAWIALWTTLRGSEGEFFGLLAGSVAMGAVLSIAFNAVKMSWLASIAALFVGNAAGYYLGDWLYHTNSQTHRYLAMTGWGACYGLGFGAGIGLAFYFSQKKARERLREVQ
jgi:hypothetical protein